MCTVSSSPSIPEAHDHVSHCPAKGEMRGRPVSPASTTSSNAKLCGRFVLHELLTRRRRRVQAEFPLSGGKGEGAGELTSIRHSSSFRSHILAYPHTCDMHCKAPLRRAKHWHGWKCGEARGECGNTICPGRPRSIAYMLTTTEADPIIPNGTASKTVRYRARNRHDKITEMNLIKVHALIRPDYDLYPSSFVTGAS